ncbi:MAG: tRNA (adenosine(37)-N6)-threonylcarbamoyltransferase complex transferase subunit TsaD [Puniceicoccales bacterium]|jgi:N6-L-threonylcarbamoyladenine synthase|nr:tRNA (adenosine(37)-N6)-threonylcarbamoyltransferase complex transferase subunit TsaD [Puniceicoccales bacterium]
MKILAIESSCDESSVAFLDETSGFLFEETISQANLHRNYGGVVPELATGYHLESIPRIIGNWRKSCDGTPDAVAVTVGPGLAGGLAMGFAAAKSLAILFRCEFFAINHLHGHALSPFMDISLRGEALESYLPHVGLLVSGGNSILFSIAADWSVKVLGATVDDAAGEALDKGAKLLGLPYPGGVEIERLAAFGNGKAFRFPVAFPGAEIRFSFSGLKTSLLYALKKMSKEEIEREKANLCASYQAAVIDALLLKTSLVLERVPAKSLGISGGVSQNSSLRSAFAELASDHGLPLLAAQKRYCGDNGSMIAFAARFPKFRKENPTAIHPKLPMGTLCG